MTKVTDRVFRLSCVQVRATVTARMVVFSVPVSLTFVNVDASFTGWAHTFAAFGATAVTARFYVGFEDFGGFDYFCLNAVSFCRAGVNSGAVCFFFGVDGAEVRVFIVFVQKGWKFISFLKNLKNR